MALAAGDNTVADDTMSGEIYVGMVAQHGTPTASSIASWKDSCAAIATGVVTHIDEFLDAGGDPTTIYLVGSYANGGAGRVLVNLFENTETTSLNAIQTGGWAPMVGSWKVTKIETSHQAASPAAGSTEIKLWQQLSPYTTNYVEKVAFTYTQGADGTVNTVLPDSDTPDSGTNPTYDFANPCDGLALSIDPTGDHGNVRWRITLTKQ